MDPHLFKEDIKYEIQEIEDALTLFEFYLEAEELPGSANTIQSRGGHVAAGLFRSPIAENVDWYFVERITVAVFAAVFTGL